MQHLEALYKVAVSTDEASIPGALNIPEDDPVLSVTPTLLENNLPKQCKYEVNVRKNNFE